MAGRERGPCPRIRPHFLSRWCSPKTRSPPFNRMEPSATQAETAGAITRSINRDSRNKNGPTLFLAPSKYRSCHPSTAGTAIGRVEVWRGGCRSNISVAAPFVWRCLTGSTLAPSPHLAHRTGHADLPHPALGQNITPSPTARHAQVGSDVRARSARRGARVDRPRPCVA